MKSDEIYDGVNAIDAVRDVLNACRSEESVKDASYSYVVTKTNTARELLGDFLDVILKEEYKDAYKKDKTAKRVFTSSMIFYDYFLRRLDLDKIAKKYTKTADKKVIMDVIATCQDVICEEADTKYRFNLEKIVKAMLLAIRTEDINSDKVQNARNILLSLLTDGDENELTQRIYTCYFASVPCMTTEKTAKEVTDWWYCVTNFPKQENEVFDSDKVIRTAINAPNRLTKRMSKQYYRKALCIAWSDTYMNNNDSDPADAWTAYYTEQ